MTVTRHLSTGRMHWKGVDPEVTAARKLPGWAKFHQECGKHQLYFDDIERDGRRQRFTAVTYTLTGKYGHRFQFRVAEGEGRTPVDAVLDAFRNAIAARHPVPEELAALLAAEPAPAATDDLAAMLGVPDPLADLIG